MFLLDDNGWLGTCGKIGRLGRSAEAHGRGADTRHRADHATGRSDRKANIFRRSRDHSGIEITDFNELGFVLVRGRNDL